MEKATITEVKNHLSAFLNKVKHGEVVLITDRGRPVARLETAVSNRSVTDTEGRLARLEHIGLVRRARTAAKSATWSMPPAPAGKSGLLQAVLAERDENR